MNKYYFQDVTVDLMSAIRKSSVREKEGKGKMNELIKVINL